MTQLDRTLKRKCDQAKEGLVNNASQMDEYCNDRGFLKWFETSAKEDININEAAKYLVSKILENDKANSFGTSERKEPSIKLTDSASLATSEYKNIPYGEAPKSGCC